MTDTRPRSFLWVMGPAGPYPQIAYDPRVGFDGLKIIRDERLKIGDMRSLDELAKAFPAPEAR